MIHPDMLAALRRTHGDLSPAAADLLERVLADPLAARPLGDERLAALPAWVRAYPYPVQPLPTLLGEEKRRQAEAATVGLTQLIKSLPERLFAADLGRVCKLYGGMDANVMRVLLAPPSGVAEAFVRWDLVDDGESFKCLEANVGMVIGGWQHRFFAEVLRSQPAVAGVLADRGAAGSFRDFWRAALAFVVQEGHRQGHAAGGSFNLAIQIDEDLVWGESMDRLCDLFTEILAASGTGTPGVALWSLRGQERLTVRDGRLHCQGQPVAAYFHSSETPVPTDIYRVFKMRRLGLYDGPLARLVGDKRSLALLSEHADSDLFSAEERRFIAAHVPWCRSLADEQVTRAGERVRLIDFALAHRESLVLKPSNGTRGRDIHLGPATPAERWRALVEGAAGDPRMLLQDYVESRPYLFAAGDQGPQPHQVVWGFFCVGTAYAGGFVRVLPVARGPEVINSAQGATESVILEV